jgi:dTDP-4-amino-4,6-dideoxygalactose transaminase
VSTATEKFEHDFAKEFSFAGAVATGFGRSAIALAMAAWEVQNREVLIPEFVCAQVAQAVRAAGGRPKYFPVELDLDVIPEKFSACMTERTAAAVVVHYYGQSLPSAQSLTAVCRERGVKLLEDCALAFGHPGVGCSGHAAVFSLTKCDWCYGGGVLASNDEGFVRAARKYSEKYFKTESWGALRYGILRRADFESNRPSVSRRAEFRGRLLDRVLGFGCDNFFDAGSVAAEMSAAAARRGLHLLKTLKATCVRRKEIAAQLRHALRDTDALSPAEQDDEGAGGFLLLRAPEGRARHWMEAAARQGITLRLSWPAYQTLEDLESLPTNRRLAEEILILEIHPELNAEEISRIANCLQRLSGEPGIR